MSDDMHMEIISAYKKKVLFTTHALNQMNLSDRMILREEVIETILEGKVIEEYSEDPRGKSWMIIWQSLRLIYQLPINGKRI